MPKVKEYPISSGVAPPPMMNIPGLKSAEPAAQNAEGNEGGADGANADDANDGFTPEERRKNQLEQDPNFAPYLKMKRMRIPLANIRARMRGEKLFDPKEMDLFATVEEIKEAD